MPSVSRVQAKGEESDMHIVLDVNSQLYPMRAGEKYRMVLSQTLNEDGSAVVAGSEVSYYLQHGILFYGFHLLGGVWFVGVR